MTHRRLLDQRNSMITVSVAVMFITCSFGKELDEWLAQDVVTERTTQTPSVSGVPQFYTTDSTNFTEVIKSDFFVDKTLFIKEILDNEVSAFIEISAAPHFGKSTNIDMLKRFLEINVDEKGNRVSCESSDNYKSFVNNSLQITKHKQVFSEHFGKYPVVAIDYKPLDMVTKFDVLLRKCRGVLLETFKRHRYLLHAEDFWSEKNSKTEFAKYLNETTSVDLQQNEVQSGFIVLIKTLFEYFKTPVVVLVDNYDVIVDAPVSENCKESVYNFIVDMNNRIIESKFVSRVILTGSLLRGGIPYSTRIQSALEKYPHILKHYGLSKPELHSLLERVFKNRTEIEDAISCVVETYSGYVRSFDAYDEMKTNPRNAVVCSVWSVIQYLTCVRKINIANIGEPEDAPSITYLSVKDRAILLGMNP